MKKKKGFQRLLCAGLVTVMTAGLCACGDDKASSANAALAKEYVYGYEEIALPADIKGDDVTIESVTRCDGRIYLTVNVYRWHDAVGSTQEVKLVSMKEDGSDMQTVEIDFSQIDNFASDEANGGDSAAGEEDSNEAAAGEGITTGSMARTEAVTVDVAVDDAFGVDSDMSLGEEDYSQLYENTYYDNYVVGRNGALYAIRQYYLEDYSDPDNYVYKHEYSICAWDLKGAFLWQTPIENLETEESYRYINKILPMADGSVNLLINGDKAGIMSINSDGTFAGEKSLPNGADVIAKSNDIVVKEDGSFIIIYYNDDWSKMYMTDYDINTDTVGQESELPESLMWNGYNTLTAGVATDIVYTNSNGVYGFNVGEEQPVQIMSYINSDLNTNNISNIILLDETHFIAFYYDRTDGVSKGAFFTKKNPEDIPDKQVLILAGSYVPYEMKVRIINYNKSSDQYRIVVKEYESYNTRDDYTASYTQLNNDIISGNMPDILIADTMLPIENYISKGPYC